MPRNLCAVAAVVALVACSQQDANTLPSATVLSPDSAQYERAVFSPDGSRVAYFAPGANGYDLVVAKADLSAPQRFATVRELSTMFWSPDGGKLAYGSTDGGFANVAVVTFGDGTARRLTKNASVEIPTGWHPRGDRVTYLAPAPGGMVVTRDASLLDGTTVPMLAESRPHFGFWSPDGTRIAYMPFEGGRKWLWVADSTGRNARALTTEGFESINDSPWSPDGRFIAYVSTRTGAPDIWVIPADGGEARQLTRDIRDDFSPRWSPDGEWIAFISTRGRQTDVWVVSAAGGEAIRVTDDPIEESDLQWIGNGRTLAFSRPTTTRSLWAIDIAGGGERQLIPDSIRVGSFRPSPVSDDLAYVVERGGGVSELRVLTAPTGESRTLVTGSARVNGVDWSPDGKSLAFESDRAGNPDIWVVSAAGGEPRQLTTWLGSEEFPAWSLDGSSIYFTSDNESKFRDVWSLPVSGGAPTRLTTTGNVNGGLSVSPSGELFLTLFGGRSGGFNVAKLTTQGKLQIVWDRGDVFEVSPRGFTPSGDSVAIVSTLPEGGRGTFFISIRTGQGRRLLGNNEFGTDFTPDGTQLIYKFGSPKVDYGILDLRDGTTRRLTNAKETQSGYWLSYDGKELIATRSVPRSGIVTVDLTRALTPAR